jgi:TRAP-type C4-dicarboxylate transport system substrate-binding protein
METPPTLRRTFAVAALALLLGAAAAVAPTPAAAQDKPVTLRLTSNSPPKAPWAMQIERIIAKIAEETKGTVKIEAFYGGQLGNEQDTIQQLARGRIDLGLFAIGAAALIVPEVQLSILPFYFASFAEQDCMLDRHLYRPFDAAFAARGVKLLGLADVGTIDVIGKKPFPNPADVRGLKAITYTKNQQMMWTALGVNGTFVGVPEWSSSLQSGLVDLGGSPMALYVPSGLNKVAPVLTQVNMWNAPGVLVVNKGVWDRLSAEQRAGVERAMAAEPAAKLRAEIRGFDAKLREMHKAGGGQIVEISAEQRAAWRNAVAPAWPEMVKSMGGEADAMFRAMEAARASCRG